MIHKIGNIYYVEITAKFFKEGNKPLKIVGVTREISNQKKAEQQQQTLITKLSEALAEKEKLLKENSMLRGLLPICSGCKKIRDDNGKWWPLDVYIQEHSEIKMTHTICPGCKEVLYPDL